MRALTEDWARRRDKTSRAREFVRRLFDRGFLSLRERLVNALCAAVTIYLIVAIITSAIAVGAVVIGAPVFGLFLLADHLVVAHH